MDYESLDSRLGLIGQVASDSGTKYIIRPFGHLILRPTRCLRSPAIASDDFGFLLETFPCKRESSFLSHSHLQGWLRSNKSKCSIWEFWLWSLSKQSCRRTIVLIRISRIVLGLMNMAVWWTALIFIGLSMVSLQNICVSATQVSPLSVWSLWTIWSPWPGVCLLHLWCHDDIHRKILQTLFRHLDFLHRWPIPAVSTNIPGKL